MTTPTTAAGRALLEDMLDAGAVPQHARSLILAIEGEAAAPYREALDELLKVLDKWEAGWQTSRDGYGTVTMRKTEARALLDGSAGSAAPYREALERLVAMLDDDTVYTTEAARDLDIAYEQHLAKCRALLRREVGVRRRAIAPDRDLLNDRKPWSREVGE